MTHKSSRPGGLPGLPLALGPKERGRRAFQTSRYDEAIACWREITEPDIALKAALAEAHFRRATVLQLSPDAISHLQSATQLRPDDAVYAYWHAVALHKHGRLDEATAEYARAESLGLAQSPGAPHRNPALSALLLQHAKGEQVKLPMLASPNAELRNPTPHMVYAEVMALAQGNGDTGVLGSVVGRLSQMSPKPLSREVGALRYCYLGVAHARRGNWIAANDNWRLGARTLPQHPIIAANLSGLWLRDIHEALARNDLAAAQHVATQAMSFSANSGAGSEAVNAAEAKLGYQAAMAAARDGKWGEAVAALRPVASALRDARAAERRPVLHNLALTCETAENWRGAAEAWRDLLRTRPRRARSNTADAPTSARSGARSGGYNAEQWQWIRARAIECYKRADLLDDAITVLRQALKADPDDVDTHLDLVRALHVNDQHQSAENEAQRLLKLHPGHVETLLQLGEMQLESGQFYMAETTMKQALDTAPNDRKVRAGMSRVLAARGEDMHRWRGAKDAVPFFQQALEYAPDDWKLWHRLAGAYFDSGQDDQARECLERTLQFGKSKPDAYLNVANAWAIEKNVAEVKNVIARAETDGALNDMLLVSIGLQLLDRVYPAPARGMMSMLMDRFGGGGPLPMARPSKPAQPELRDYAHELLARAMRHELNVVQLQALCLAVMGKCPHEAKPYVERLIEIAPNDAKGYIMRACVQAIAKEYREAEASLDQARRHARAANQREDEEMARELRRVIREPEFATLIQGMFDTTNMADFDLDDLDLDFDD